MKKILPYIFILTIIVQFFAPFSVETNETNKRLIVSLENNIALAEEDIKFQYINIETTLVEGAEEIDLVVKVSGDTSIAFSSWATIFSYDYYLETTLLDKDKKTIDGYNPKTEFFKVEDQDAKTYSFKFKNLTKNTDYFLQIKFGIYETTGVGGTFKSQKTQKKETIVVPAKTKNEGEEVTQTNLETIGDSNSVDTSTNRPDDAFNCNIGNLRGCFAEFAYTIIFKPSAFLFGLTGKALDFTLMYSLDDKSYRSVFVVEGWGIVRDICNLFFIFILLYIAFKVVLGLGSGKSDPKSLIINVIIIGLLINFSLFATRLIIDASNILSRVFYNSETISFKSSSGADATLGSAGEIKFSEVLVQKVNPVSLLTQSGNIGYLGEKSENMTEALTEAERDQNIGSTVSRAKQISDDVPVGLGTFVIICFLTAGICIIGIVVFFNLTFVFIARVVMLWLAMILSPLAFFSHTTPELEGLKFIGFRNWLKETASMAFVAPIFCFFLYIIITFLDSGLGITDAYRSPTGFEFVLRILIPFLFLSVLLMKAKDIAISMSGQAGKFVSDMGNKIAGTTIGLATGGAAMAMRGTVGAMGARMARSETLTNMEKKGGFKGLVGGTLRNAGLKVGQKSFDFRNTTIGEKAASGLGISGSVEKTMASGSKPGVGIIGNREQRLKDLEENQAKRDKFKPQTEDEKDKEKLTEQQIRLENKNAVEIEKKEKEKEKAKEEYDEKTAEFKRTEDNRKVAEAEYNRSKGTADETGKKKALDDAREQEANALKERNEADAKLKKAREEVANINRGGKTVNIDDAGNHIVNKYNTTNGNITQEMYDKAQEKKREAEAEEVVALAEKQRLEGEKNDKILNVGAEERRKSAQATLVFDEEKQKAEDKRDETIRTAEQSFDTQIGDKETELKNLQSQLILAIDPQKVSQINREKARITQEIKDLEANKTKQVSNIRTKADQEYNEMMKLITKNKTDQVTQASKEADEKRQAIIETIRTAEDRHTEAQNKTRVATATANFAEEAKTYAESNGGFGKSSSGLKKEINELDSKIKQNTNEKMINRADHIPGSWMLTRDQVREKRSKIIESAKRK